MPSVRPATGDSSWFVRDRLGLFIHWGLYALGARHEWVKQREQIPDDRYDRYFRHFDPDLYDPAQWADAAADAGMKYFVITTKHHEGFCLWDSALTDYKATLTPGGRDLLAPMVEAFRARGLRVGFYHSLIDWHHPHFTIDDLHSRRNDPDRDRINRDRDQGAYARYLHGQVRELLTQFGKIDILWFDFSYPSKPRGRFEVGKSRDDWQSEQLVKLVRELQPDILLNDRLDLAEHPGAWDIKTPEQYQPRQWVVVDGRPVVWEACQTFSGSWGYHRDETSWKSDEQLVQMLIDGVSKGGNLLLNVGPTGRGEFDQRARDRLAAMGAWMRRHGRSIYGCTQAPEEFRAPADTRLTYDPAARRLYVHVFAWPFKHLHLDGRAYADQVAYAQLLNDASEICWNQSEGAADASDPGGAKEPVLSLELPIQKPPVTVPVIELFLK